MTTPKANGFCPNLNIESEKAKWDILESHLGSYADALTAFKEFNANSADPSIPSPAQADAVMKKLAKANPDEKFNRMAEEHKLNRVKEQESVLNNILENSRLTGPQRATLRKLMESNTSRYRELLENNLRLIAEGKPPIRTVSVSNFIGSPEYNNNPADTENFKRFGIFMHQVVEDLQQAAVNSKTSGNKIFNRAFFDEVYKKFQEKSEFSITGVTEDVLYDMAGDIIRNLALAENAGYLILPEITILGDTKGGGQIVGRMDLLMIDPMGNAKIFDFKTKKVAKLLIPDAAGVKHVSEHSAKNELATKIQTIDKIDGTAGELQHGVRTTYETWTLQLKVYENILRQHDIHVDDQKIIGLIYQADSKKRYEGHKTIVFEGNMFYYNATHMSITDKDGKMINIDQKETELRRLRNIIDKLIPISEEQEVLSEKNINRGFPFGVSELQNNEMVSKLKLAIDTELKKVYRQIHDNTSRGNEEYLKLLQQRKDTLNAFRKAVEADNSLQAASLKMKFAFESIQSDVMNMVELARAAHKRFQDPKTRTVADSHV